MSSAHSRVFVAIINVAVALCALSAYGQTSQSGSGGNTQFREKTVTTHHQQDPDVTDIDCEDCGDICSGAVYVSATRVVYFLDNVCNKVRVDSVGALTVIPGPTVTAQNEIPTDICVLDGVIYLLSDRRTLHGRYVLHRQSPGHSSWETAVPFDVSDIGWATVSGKAVPLTGAARITATSDGRVVLYATDPTSSPALDLADKNGLLPPNARIRRPPGVNARGGIVTQQPNLKLAAQSARGFFTLPQAGVFLGVDDQGNIYQRRPASEAGEDLLEKYSPTGQRLASALIPARPTTSLIRGKGPFQVHPSGDVYQFRFTDAGLVVTRWTLGD